MNVKRAAAAVALTGALVAATAACSTERDDDCRTQYTPVYYFMGADHHYHYGSPTGQTVPHWKLPKSATKVPGYKPVPGTLTKPVNPRQQDSSGKPAGSGTGTKPQPKAPAAKQPAPAPKAPAPAPRRR